MTNNNKMSIIYEEIKDANKIISAVAADTDMIYKNLKIFGTIEHPLYLLDEVAFLLDIKNSDNIIKTFTARECISARIKSDPKPRKLLTEHGLYRIMFINNTEVGVVFREFIYMVLDKLKQNRYVKLDDVNKEMNEKFSEEIKQAYEFLKSRVANLELEIINTNKTLRKNTDLAFKKEAEAAELYQDLQDIRRANLKLQTSLIRAEKDNLNDTCSDEALLEYLKNKYMKYKSYLYLLPSRDDSDYNYDYKEFSKHNPPDDYDEMYYRISRSNSLIKGVLIKEFSFEADNHISLMRDELKCHEQSDDVYFTSINNINEAYINARSAPIIQKKAERKAELDMKLSLLLNYAD
jgi:hypothetical protein